MVKRGRKTRPGSERENREKKQQVIFSWSEKGQEKGISNSHFQLLFRNKFSFFLE